MKRMITRYQIVTRDSWRVIRRGFKNWGSAYDVILQIDWGQYEEEGGLTVRPYTCYPD